VNAPASHAWSPAPPHLALDDEGVHVWRVDLDRSAGRCEALLATLSADERARTDRCLQPRVRERLIVARGALRSILAGYLGCAPGDVRFRYGPHGKPGLDFGAQAEPLSFNLSHSHGMAVCAVTRARQLGIDVELTARRVDFERVAERFFSRREVDALMALPPALRRQGFFRCWTGKEAYVKARGEGLARALAHFAVSLDPAVPAQLLAVDWDAREVDRWRLQAFEPAADHLGTLAVEGSGWRLSCLDWR
jgi:4'-phosphopantetheinyl transferase